MSGNSSQLTLLPWQFKAYTIAIEGYFIACIFSGVYFVIVGTNLYLLQKKRYRTLILWLYTIAQLVVTIVFLAISLYGAPAKFLEIFNGPPGATLPWPHAAANVAFVLNNWMSDGFLLYRCYAICLGNRYALAFAVLLYLATIGSSVAWLAIWAFGTAYSMYSVTVVFLCYWSCTTAMNICTSCLISARLWTHRQAISAAAGSQQGVFYLGYMAITLESALLYTIFATIALVVFLLDSPLQHVFLPVLCVVQAIAPPLLIHRIVRGMSFETDEYRTVMTSILDLASSTT